MELSIENMDSETIFYKRRIGTYGPENFILMDTLKTLMKDKNVFNNDTIIYGIALDNPNITSPQNCRYDVATNTEISSNEISKRELPSGKYATFLIDHTTEAVQSFWNTFSDHLSESSLEFDNSRPILERYKQSLVSNSLCEILVPIY
ncbi:GyrI-like domain-containing protein [Enterococcus sp. ALS3]|uniref:GyrI-like domain-containing protein n=1 Tax=Enterococcus alishanensis TaxID=1303817 RepID=A0ABS6TH99_9ENTE|nr:GyrI-like domain-containing protein [Enterococcus alishanensis]MBV7392248.1 GyrI-like domain-containing protein [Enterococcus alishanensis]